MYRAAVCWYASVWDSQVDIEADTELFVAHERTFREHGPELAASGTRHRGEPRAATCVGTHCIEHQSGRWET
jgi:hypothetical protein